MVKFRSLLVSFFIIFLPLNAWADKGMDRFMEGEAAYSAGEYDKALEILLPIAQSDLVWTSMAQYRIGQIYHLPNTVVGQSLIKSSEWLEKAFADGFMPATDDLGRVYSSRGLRAAKNGNITAANEYFKASVEWYKLSAELPNPIMGFEGLGDSYRHGRGVVKDLDIAANYYGKASKEGRWRSQYFLAQTLEERFKQNHDMADLEHSYMWYKIAGFTLPLITSLAQRGMDRLKESFSLDQLSDVERGANRCIRSDFKNCDLSKL